MPNEKINLLVQELEELEIETDGICDEMTIRQIEIHNSVQWALHLAREIQQESWENMS